MDIDCSVGDEDRSLASLDYPVRQLVNHDAVLTVEDYSALGLHVGNEGVLTVTVHDDLLLLGADLDDRLINSCEKLAYEYGNQQIEQEHLLYALLTVEDSLIAKLAEKMGIEPAAFTDEARQLIAGLPKVQGSSAQVYVSGNLNDGKTETYWESKGFPAELVIDLEGTYTVSAAAVCLNPSAIWEPRIQEISIAVSLDGETFTEVSPATAYTFDAAFGNRIRIDFEPAEAAFIRVVMTSNTAYPAHSGGAQAAEICIY